MIAVRAVADAGQRLAAIGRSEGARIEHVDDVFAARVGEHVRVVERTLADIAARVHQFPRGAGVVRAVKAAVLVLDERVDAVRVRTRDTDADLAHEPLRQALIARDLAPGVAAVGGLVQAAARTAARHLVFDAVGLPQRGEHHVRVPAIDRDIRGAGLRVLEQHLLPRRAAVGALEDAALVARHAVLAEVGDEHDVGIRRMDADFRDRVGVGEADVGPGLARVGRLVDAVAGHDVAADARFTHPDVHRVGVRLGDSDRPDRCALDLTIGDRRPVHAAVGRLPQAAADGAEVAFLRPPFHARHGNRSAAAERTDAAPAERIEDGLIEIARRRRAALGCRRRIRFGPDVCANTEGPAGAHQ